MRINIYIHIRICLQVCSTNSPQAAGSCRACTCHVPHRHRKQGHKMGLMRTDVATAYFVLVATSYYFIILQSNIFEPNQKGKEKSDRFKQSLAAISFWALMQGGRPTATGHVSQCCRRAGQLGSANQTAFDYIREVKMARNQGESQSLEGQRNRHSTNLLSQTNYMHSH